MPLRRNAHRARPSCLVPRGEQFALAEMLAHQERASLCILNHVGFANRAGSERLGTTHRLVHWSWAERGDFKTRTPVDPVAGQQTSGNGGDSGEQADSAASPRNLLHRSRITSGQPGPPKLTARTKHAGGNLQERLGTAHDCLRAGEQPPRVRSHDPFGRPDAQPTARFHHASPVHVLYGHTIP
jgi:hypothetical protein